MTKKDQRVYAAARKMTESEARFTAKVDGRVRGDFSFLNRRGERCLFRYADQKIVRLPAQEAARG